MIFVAIYGEGHHKLPYSDYIVSDLHVLFREAISHPYISFFYLLVNGFSVTSFRTFLKTPNLYYTSGQGY